jgi:hypothetical protein
MPPGNAVLFRNADPIGIADALYAEFATCGVAFTRGLANTSWHSREFVVKDLNRFSR